MKYVYLFVTFSAALSRMAKEFPEAS